MCVYVRHRDLKYFIKSSMNYAVCKMSRVSAPDLTKRYHNNNNNKKAWLLIEGKQQ